MTGPEHYREAELLLVEENSCASRAGSRRLIALAQAHATLALAMATALGEQETEYKDWLRVNAGGDLS